MQKSNIKVIIIIIIIIIIVIIILNHQIMQTRVVKSRIIIC